VTSELIELRGVALTYPGPPPVTALRPADLDVRAGEYVAVVGRSGSGKSTLLNVLALIDRPTGGTYRFAGADTGAMGEAERTSIRARRIGLVFQAFHLIGHRTAVENVALGLLYQGVRRRQRVDAAREALAGVGLGDRGDTATSRLSGGERQRVAIARALVSEPSLLLCDEPTGNLDSETADTVLAIIDRLHAGGLTIVMITHDAEVAARAGRLVSIMDGVLTDRTDAADRA